MIFSSFFFIQFLFLRYIIFQDESNAFYLADFSSQARQQNSFQIHQIFSLSQSLSLNRNQFCFNDDDDLLNFMPLSDEEKQDCFFLAFYGLDNTFVSFDWKKNKKT